MTQFLKSGKFANLLNNKTEQQSEKTFLVFNTACFGDVLLCNSLCQNIKTIYPNSKIVFICDKPFYDVAKMQKDVDDVVIYDKKGEHKGLQGMLKFIKIFEYKKPYASFVTYSNLRNVLISWLLGAKHTVEAEKYKKPLSTQIKHNRLLNKITNQQVVNYPIKCEINSEIESKFKEFIVPENKYIGLCTISKSPAKDMPIETAKEFIKVVNKDNQYKILYFGIGAKNKQYAQELQEAGCEFIDLVNRTTIYELAQIIKICVATVSVDTGTMHLSYALEVPTLAVFYEEKNIINWAPDEELYNVKVLTPDTNAEKIYNELLGLIKNQKESICDKDFVLTTKEDR
jgi:ADP-heptose:LPS heptosyltransferase